MSTKNDGGPAFSRPVSFSEEGGIHRGTLGMSLRDYFAGQALASLISQRQIRALNKRIYKLWPPKIGWDRYNHPNEFFTYGKLYYLGDMMGEHDWMLDGMTPIDYESAKHIVRRYEKTSA